MKDALAVEKIRKYIERHLHEDLSLDRLSRKLNYSKFYIGRVFAEGAGCTIYKYIQRRRLAEAAKQLISTDKPIVEIALEARYNSQQAFTLAFRRLYGCTPYVCRKKGRSRIKRYVGKKSETRVCYAASDRMWKLLAA